MFREPLARAFHEKAVKSIIWDGLPDLANIGRRNAEPKETKGEVNQIAFSEDFHKRIDVCLVCANLVVHFDH